MTTEQAIRWLNGLKANETLSATKEALDIAINAVETGEIYISGEDYDLYMEGYKAGKKDFEPKQGEWIRTGSLGNGNARYECSNCHRGDVQAESQEVPYCWHCGAKMQKGGADNVMYAPELYQGCLSCDAHNRCLDAFCSNAINCNAYGKEDAE